MKAVVLPTYNEAENLREAVWQIRQQPGGFHVLVADDASPDGTGGIADEVSNEFPGEARALRVERDWARE